MNTNRVMQTPSKGYHRTVPENTVPDSVRPLFSVHSTLVIPVTRKCLRAYDRLFGAHLPHHAMARLNGFNSTALTRGFKADALRILSQKDLAYYYSDPEETMRSQIFRAIETDSEGSLLIGWKTISDRANPHHIVPQSRYGTGNEKNLRHIDRKVHDDFHTLFTNFTPGEQLLHLLSVFSDEFNPLFVLEMLKVLSETDLSYYYQKGTIAKRVMTVA